MAPVKDIYSGRDPRELPAYSIAEAAGLLRLPQTTLRHGCRGKRIVQELDRVEHVP